MNKYGKSYDSLGEVRDRLKLYQAAKVFVDSENSKNTNYQLELNYFADLKQEEMNSFRGYISSNAVTNEYP